MLNIGILTKGVIREKCQILRFIYLPSGSRPCKAQPDPLARIVRLCLDSPYTGGKPEKELQKEVTRLCFNGISGALEIAPKSETYKQR